MRSAMWLTVAALAASAASSTWALQGNGLIPSQQDPWPRWQGRLAVGTTQSPLAADGPGQDGSGLKLGGASLFGDFYFSRSIRGAAGSGFRATSGIFVGSTSAALLSGPPAGVIPGKAFSVERRHLGIWGIAPAEASTDPQATPYVGIGYTGLAKSGWGFSADLGLVALNPGSAVKLGRMFNGQSLDDTLREMRLAPVVRLGVSYSF